MAVPSSFPSSVGFFDLPGEIKNMVYNLVFQGVTLKLGVKALDRINSEKAPPPLDLSTTPTKNALLGTCRAIRTEAMPVLAKHTNLDIRHVFKREDPLTALPPMFLHYISRITVDINAFVHLNRKLLPCLNHVTLVTRVEGISDLPMALHHLHCTNCGGPDAFLEDATADVQDWNWKTTQFRYLAKEQSWTVVLTVQWECTQPRDSYLEVSYDIKHLTILSQQCVVGEKVFDAVHLDEATAEAEKLIQEEDERNGIKEPPYYIPEFLPRHES